MKAAGTLLTIATVSLLTACATHPNSPGSSTGPLLIHEQGSFAAGGTMITAPGTFNPRQPMAPDGQTHHGDHAYAFYQIPADARKLPIVMWHGAGQAWIDLPLRQAELVLRDTEGAAIATRWRGFSCG